MNKTNDGVNALKHVMSFVLLICALIIGFAVELAIAGMDIVYWTFSARGLWLVLWTSITYLIAMIRFNHVFATKKTIDMECESNQ